MNEMHIACRVRQHLNQGLAELPADRLERLRQARNEALRHQKAPAHSPILAGVGHFFQFHGERLRPRHLIGALALIAAATLYAHWEADAFIGELEETDSALLSTDAPIEAFADKGFAAWLKDSPQP